MEDIIKSIRAFLYSRSVSPLLGAFVVAWSVFNYRFWLIIFSNIPYYQKFVAIDNYFNSFDFRVISGKIIAGFIYPAIVAWVYLYLYQMLAEPVFKHSLEKHRKLREIKQKAEEEKLLSEKESRELYRHIAELQDEIDKKDEFYSKQVSSLNKIIENFEGEIEKNKQEKIDSVDQVIDFMDDKVGSSGGDNTEDFLSQHNNISNNGGLVVDRSVDDEVNSQMIRVLAFLGQNGSQDPSVIRRDSGLSNAKITYIINKLIKIGYLEQYPSGQVVLTNTGTSFVIENGIVD